MVLCGKIYISSGKMLESHLMEETTNDQSDKMFMLRYKNFDPRGCLPLPGAIYMYKNMKLVTNGQSDKAFLLTSIC